MEVNETIFNENKLKFNPNDDRWDNTSEISSEDEKVYDKDYERDYTLSQSGSTCQISEIKNIIYGGTSSRFWLFRKYMN